MKTTKMKTEKSLGIEMKNDRKKQKKRREVLN